MPLAELQEAMRPRNSDRGQDVVNNVFIAGYVFLHILGEERPEDSDLVHAL